MAKKSSLDIQEVTDFIAASKEKRAMPWDSLPWRIKPDDIASKERVAKLKGMRLLIRRLPEPNEEKERIASDGWNRQSVSQLANLVEKRLFEIYEATNQRLSHSELAERFTDAITMGKTPSVPTVHAIEAEIISDCNAVSRDQNWDEFREVAKQLEELNTKVTDYNTAPTLRKADIIMEQSHQRIPPIMVRIQAQMNSRFL
jgi:hypothetical protein